MVENDLPSAQHDSIETRGYQQEMLEESLRRNIIIAMDTGSGKTHIAVLRIKHEAERETRKLSWFLAPTVALCEQQCNVIKSALHVSVGQITGALAPDQWKDASLWKAVLNTHQVMVSTPQILLDALRHGYIIMGDIGLIIFDEAHHAVNDDPYNRIMQEFYHPLPARDPSLANVMSRQSRERPMIMGLTASPIFGGNVDKSFRIIETNLDCKIVSPRASRAELKKFVHRPAFRHVMYNSTDSMNLPFSTNLASLESVVEHLEIDNDPYIKSLRNQLSRLDPHTAEYRRIDQQLSKTMASQGTFTHKGLRDFVSSAREILREVGVWAADWYVAEVLQQAKKASQSSEHVMPSWQSQEKAYLLGIINQIMITPVSYNTDDIIDDQSDKVTALIECLLGEKEDAEKENERFSGLIFVQRRDVVLALTELLKHHPVTKSEFEVGSLLGASDNSQRHAFLDITRKFLKRSQDETLTDFKLGDKNLIISTAVAEEGIDVQACGCVIRWDHPPNMASWAQSRGRARKKRSTFIMMFETGSVDQGNVLKWEKLEEEMVARYMDPSRDLAMEENEHDADNEDFPPFRVESTGALLTLQSAIPHLNHFCAVMPHRGHFVYQPLYDLDPPDYPIGWHSFNNHHTSSTYAGPWASTVTLPRVLPQDLRVFRTPQIYTTKVSAHRHAAFETYKVLYQKGLLSENLLPLVDEDPEIEELKKAIEKRTGMASVSLQMDPWGPDMPEEEQGGWFVSRLMVGNLPPIQMLTRRRPPLLTLADELKLYHPSLQTLDILLEPLGKLGALDDRILEVREYTRMLFWSINGSRMKWDDTDFAYLFFHPSETSFTQWNARRAWWKHNRMDVDGTASTVRSPTDFTIPALTFGEIFHYPSDIGMVYNGSSSFKAYEFVQWKWDSLNEEEEATLLERYARSEDVQIRYPLLEVRSFHPRTNFLLPRFGPAPSQPSFFLLPQHASIPLLSQAETNHAFLLPSVLRALALNLTVDSLRTNLFTQSSILSTIPNSFLITAMCAPVSQEPKNYQRYETLGDTVLKLVVALQLLAEYPLWPEGYLTKRKDHSVSNVMLAKENVSRELYQWIIRDRLVGKKWKPLYLSQTVPSEKQISDAPEQVQNSDTPESAMINTLLNPSMNGSTEENEDKKKKKKGKHSQQLSTKVLADVVESLIGAAYVHGGLSLGYECARFFKLNIESWLPIPDRIISVLMRADMMYTSFTSTSPSEEIQFPPQLSNVEKIIGYTFLRPTLLLEALTHPSCQEDHGTISYERMEFLGDAVLDMIVTDYLFYATGKNGKAKEYSPGHMFLRKSATVNAHILAFVCLKSKLEVKAQMPKAYALNDNAEDKEGTSSKKKRYRGEQKIVLEEEQHTVHLFKCLLHSSTRILDDQDLTYKRFLKFEAEIIRELEKNERPIFPWAALTRIQAPKFFSDMIESILGAVYLDSEGNMDVVREVMLSLGLYQILERIVKEDLDVLHPVSRLSMWAATQTVTDPDADPEAIHKKIKYDFKKERGRISCAVLVDGIELEGSMVDDVYGGKATQEEVRLAAAEKAIQILRLRDVGVEYESLKKKRKPKPKKQKEGKTSNKAPEIDDV
ncbi:uncharacterized protein C8R40DRAFT_1164658 [Lentinula edodes]|uniref:uncharacterized protein n=1 Tax=Lentinula edodes TaxID=5353 RepID=UPI001E8DD50E|nr:uncharacterized protein C8R40DRAFT_1164658 [Lentinula edodes]KAH7881254.1 hypothetical protein C8R40DRAFT_1164658 [Lentinula edodes]